MADSRAQMEAARWVVDEWIPANLKLQAQPGICRLTSGGGYNFDAVSADRRVAICVSTSSSRTSSGRLSAGTKIRSSLYFLLLADVERKLLLVTEQDMFDWCVNECSKGRIPGEIEIYHVHLPDKMRSQVDSARAAASREVSPRG